MPADAQIPYASNVDRGSVAVVDHLGIEAWYVETNRLGHYLAVKCSRTAIEKLVDAVNEIGLGVRGWGESRRRADDGVFYDWYIRLEFTGSREKCLQRVEELLVAEDDDIDETFEDEEPGDREVRRGELTDLLMALASTPLDAEDVAVRIATFGEDAELGCGYLAWRYREVCTRPGHVVEDSAESELAAMATLVRDEKALLARLSSLDGPFLAGGPYLAERALTAELDRVDTDDSWWSPDDALRRCRTSLHYLHTATVLSFGTDNGFNLLSPTLEQLRPPDAVRLGNVPSSVAAAASNLTRLIELVNELIGVDDPAALRRRGRAELSALQDGEFDCLADLPEMSQPHDQPLLGDLPFEVLPPGELLSSFVDELRRSGTYLDREVDQRRLEVLTKLRSVFHPGRR
ncbi:hypothetical protein [Mycobacterium sp. 23]|uniref:hypothetical protein n=1 Tax=Mycobacterium sp. 23 TaxID=3400424 RepID=UPI003AAFDCC6